MDDFGDAGVEGVGGGAQRGEDSLRGKREEKGDDGNYDDVLPFSDGRRKFGGGEILGCV